MLNQGALMESEKERERERERERESGFHVAAFVYD